MNGFNVVDQQIIAMYDSGCQICCNCMIQTQAGFYVPAHRSNMPQINMIPPPTYFKLTLGQPALF